MKFTWIGGPSFALEVGPFRVLGDPVLADRFELPGIGEVRRLGARPAIDLSGDAVLVSSLRADHYDPDAIGRSKASMVLAPAGATAVAGARTLGWGESVRLEKPGVTLNVAAVPAGAPGEPGADRGNGYFLRLEGGARPYTVYWTGDARFSDETRKIQGAHGYSNLLIINLGAERAGASVRSADAKDGMQIIYRMQPNAIAPIHHTTFSHYAEDVTAFKEKVDLTIYEKRLHVLAEGESFEKVIGPE